MWRVLSGALLVAAVAVIVAILIFDGPRNNAMWWALGAVALGFAGVAAANRARGEKAGGS